MTVGSGNCERPPNASFATRFLRVPLHRVWQMPIARLSLPIWLGIRSNYFLFAKKPGLVNPCAFPSADLTGGATSFLVSRSLYCGGNDSHPPPSALYKAIRFVVTAVWLCAKRSSFP